MPLSIPIPPEWKGRELLARAFTSLCPGLKEGPESARAVCFGDLGIALQVADFDFTAIAGFGMYLNAGQPQQDIHFKQEHAPPSTYLLLYTPVGDSNGTEADASKRLDSLEGWALGFWDRNIAYGRVTEFTVTKEGAHSVASPSWENPANAPAPIASQGNWDAFSRMLQK